MTPRQHEAIRSPDPSSMCGLCRLAKRLKKAREARAKPRGKRLKDKRRGVQSLKRYDWNFERGR